MRQVFASSVFRRILVLAFVAALVAALPSKPEGKTYEFVVDTSEGAREYLLHVPSSVGDQPSPIVFVFHGGGGPLGSAELMLQRSGWKEESDRRSFITVFAQGTLENPEQPMNLSDDPRDSARNIRSWSDGSGVTPASVQGVDDVVYVRAVLEDVARRFSVDREKVFATGFSNGATFSYYLGVHLSDVFAAVAPVAGLLYADPFSATSPVSLLHIVGEEDTMPETQKTGILQRGSPVKNSQEAAQSSAYEWSKALACMSSSSDSRGGEVRTWHWEGCSGGAKVESHVIAGLAHVYPGKGMLFGDISWAAYRLDATSLIAKFFSEHPRFLELI